MTAEIVGTSKLFVPSTNKNGEFKSSGGYPHSQQLLMCRDDGQMEYLDLWYGIDHDQRVVRIATNETEFAKPLTPSAIQLEMSAERRKRRFPFHQYEHDGIKDFYSEWSYADGEAVEVDKRDGGLNIKTYFDRVIHFDDKEPESKEIRRVDKQTITAYDYQWNCSIERSVDSFFLIPYYSNTSSDTAHYVADKYRRILINNYTSLGDYHKEESYIQGHIRNVLIAGRRSVGWIDQDGPYSYEVTAVREFEQIYSETRKEWYTRGTYVDMWIDLADYSDLEYGGRPKEGVLKVGSQGYYHYIRRKKNFPEDEAGVLRDVILSKWPEPPTNQKDAFTACDGKVRVIGGRGDNQHDLSGRKLEAFGHTFEGGSWAAIRDAPERDEQGKVVNWNTVLVIHIGEEKVTAVRESGKADVIPLGVFLTDVLRYRGVFDPEKSGFSPVGSLYNTWPSDRAWVMLPNEFRAVTLHEAWRDSQVNLPSVPLIPAGQDESGNEIPASFGPEFWYWSKRPPRRPAPPKTVPDAPQVPLRLTLADVADMVRHDERLKRGEAPLQLPLTATTNGADVMPAVAKKFYFPPAGWDEELNDKRSAASPLTLTFKLPPPPKPPSADFPGEDWGAALMLRLKTKDTTIVVNGVKYPLQKLGHNAGEKKGWHPYVVKVPVKEKYVLKFQGKCSRALLCVRILPNIGKGEAS